MFAETHVGVEHHILSMGPAPHSAVNKTVYSEDIASSRTGAASAHVFGVALKSKEVTPPEHLLFQYPSGFGGPSWDPLVPLSGAVGDWAP